MTTTTSTRAARPPRAHAVVVLLCALVGLLAMHVLAAAPAAAAPFHAVTAAAAGAHAPHGPAHGADGHHAPPAHHGDGATSCDLLPAGGGSGVAPLVTALAGTPALLLAGPPPAVPASAHRLPPTTGPPGHATSCVLRT